MAETEVSARAGGVARVATLAKFYLGCIEAEQAAALAVAIDGDYCRTDTPLLVFRRPTSCPSPTRT